MLRKNKKAAIELSIGTIVVIVLAMTMLILGIVLVRSIFTGATESVNEINEGVKSEIKKLFQDENDKAVIRLTDNTAKIKQGDEFNFVFAVRNNEEGSVTQTYSYKTELADKGTCGDLSIPASWILFGEGTLSAAPQQTDEELIRLKVPSDSQICSAKFQLKIYKGTTQSDSNIYEGLSFFVEIEGSGVF